MNFVLCESFGANVHESASKQASRILMQIIPNPSCKTIFLSDKQKKPRIMMMKDSCMLLVIHYYKCFFCLLLFISVFVLLMLNFRPIIYKSIL